MHPLGSFHNPPIAALHAPCAARSHSSTSSAQQRPTRAASAPAAHALPLSWETTNQAPPVNTGGSARSTFTPRAKLSCQLWETEHPLRVLTPDALTSCTSHLRNASAIDLVRQWVALAASGNAALVRQGPTIVKTLEWTRARLPIVGELVWQAFEAVRASQLSYHDPYNAEVWSHWQGMRPTFFHIFVGGESVSACAAKIDAYAAQGVGSLLNYSAESDHEHDHGFHTGPAIHQEQVDEAVSALSQCGHFPTSGAPAGIKSTFVSIKLTGIIADAFVLARASAALERANDATQPEGGTVVPASTLSAEDEHALASLYQAMRTIAAEARRQQARLLIDAEQSWFQPAIDRIVDLLAEEYNVPGVPGPIVFNTYQAYKRTTPGYLRASIERADCKGYMFGAKLVRGAYMEAERDRHAERAVEGECVVWGSKTETDDSYDACAELLARRVASQVKADDSGLRSDICFAGHNGTSVKKVLEVFSNEGLLTREERGPGLVLDEGLRGRIQWGQLMGERHSTSGRTNTERAGANSRSLTGMSDNLTDTLTSLLYPSRAASPSAGLPYLFKAIPYATVEQAIPYLLRRANENQSILQGDPTSGRGGAKEARRAVGREMRRRMGLAL